MIDLTPQTIGEAEDVATRLEETSLTLKDHLVTRETTLVSNAVNKDTSPATARRDKIGRAHV